MAEVGYIASAVLTGIVLIALVAVLARVRQWRPAPTGDSRMAGGRMDGGVVALLTDVAHTPLAWTIGFLVLVLAFGAGAIAFVAAPAASASIAGAVGVAVALMFASALGAYLLWGVYHSVRNRGISDAQAAMVGLWVVGLLLIAVVALNLVMAG